MAFIAYGYEIFAMHLSIDEEISGAGMTSPEAWLEQGRWGMFLLNSFLLPTVGPTLSTAIGVLGFCCGIFLVLSRLVSSNIALTAGTLFGIVFPTLPFTLTFGTLAYGAGVAAVSSSAAYSMIQSDRPLKLRLILAVLFITFSISIYQPFLFIGPLVAGLGLLACVVSGSSLKIGLVSFLSVTGSSVGAIGLYYVVDQTLRSVTSTELTYVQGFIDLTGFWRDPLGRTDQASQRVIDVLSVSPTLFSGRTQHVDALLIVCALVLVFAGLRRDGIKGGIAVAGILLLVLLMLIAVEVTTPAGVPVRSLVYIPFVLAGFVAIALAAIDLGPRSSGLGFLALVAAVALLSVGLTADINRLFWSSALTLDRDIYMVREIERELADTRSSLSGLEYLAVIGSHPSAEGPITPKREAFGNSFFEWEGGNVYRIVALFRLFSEPPMQTLQALPPLSEAKLAIGDATTMPEWPAQGSLRIVGDTVILKFGDPTELQEARWCDAGARAYCGG